MTWHWCRTSASKQRPFYSLEPKLNRLHSVLRCREMQRAPRVKSSQAGGQSGEASHHRICQRLFPSIARVNRRTILLSISSIPYRDLTHPWVQVVQYILLVPTYTASYCKRHSKTQTERHDLLFNIYLGECSRVAIVQLISSHPMIKHCGH